MKFFTSTTTLLSLAGLVAATAVPRQFCPQASRFGTFSVSPTTVNPGDVCLCLHVPFLVLTSELFGQEITISTDLSCAIDNFGIIPKYLDYSIFVPSDSNSGHEPNIVLARRDFDFSAGLTSDQFTNTVRFSYQMGLFFFVRSDHQLFFLCSI